MNGVTTLFTKACKSCSTNLLHKAKLNPKGFRHSITKLNRSFMPCHCPGHFSFFLSPLQPVLILFWKDVEAYSTVQAVLFFTFILHSFFNAQGTDWKRFFFCLQIFKTCIAKSIHPQFLTWSCFIMEHKALLAKGFYFSVLCCISCFFGFFCSIYFHSLLCRMIAKTAFLSIALICFLCQWHHLQFQLF